MIFGLLCDDVGKFLGDYLEVGIFEKDLFVLFDKDGVGDFVWIVVEWGWVICEGLKLGICGEYGGDLFFIDFCEEMGLDYVFCLLYCVLIVCLVAV